MCPKASMIVLEIVNVFNPWNFNARYVFAWSCAVEAILFVWMYSRCAEIVFVWMYSRCATPLRILLLWFVFVQRSSECDLAHEIMRTHQSGGTGRARRSAVLSSNPSAFRMDFDILFCSVFPRNGLSGLKGVAVRAGNHSLSDVTSVGPWHLENMNK